nr:uncharacterized protein LOC104093758 isoform X3 [Nicotiana tomentosiformis]
MRKTQSSKESVEKLRKEVEKFYSAGDIPLDLLMEETVPAAYAAVLEASEAVAGQSEELATTSHTVEEQIQMLSNLVVPQLEDVEIQLEDTEGVDEPMHAKDTVHVEDPMKIETT